MSIPQNPRTLIPTNNGNSTVLLCSHNKIDYDTVVISHFIVCEWLNTEYVYMYIAATSDLILL